MEDKEFAPTYSRCLSLLLHKKLLTIVSSRLIIVMVLVLAMWR
ncbi:hypothetical protein DSUL_60266 [Desulfovibrionales bacterium]